MIVGIGIDIIEIDRVERAARKPGFMARVFTPEEIARFEERNMPAQSIAGAFAAKEAMAKALGTGIGEVQWTELEVCHDGGGRPVARLHGRAKERLAVLGGRAMHISISHSKGLAVAQAMAEGAQC